MDNKYKLKAILNTAFKPLKFRVNGKDHFQVFLSITSDDFDPDLSKVLFVQYELHHSFKDRYRISKNKTNNFEIEIKTYGTFDVKVTINLNTGDNLTFIENYKNVLEKLEL